MTQYVWRDGTHFAGDAEEVFKELSRIHKKYGRLTSKIVVKEAKKKSSPLYKHFEWDKDKAAMRHWLEEARKLIVAVRVIRDDSPPERIFVNVIPQGEGEWRTMAEVLGNEDYRRGALQRALAEFEALERKYRDYQELFEVFEAVKRVRKKVA